MHCWATLPPPEHGSHRHGLTTIGFVGSRLTEVEVYRTIAKTGQHPSQARPYLGKFTLLLIDPVVDDAIALQQRLAAGDAIHLATAQTLGPETVAIVTHDLQMAKAATQIGFTVIDPVTDDPGCTPVA